MTTEELIEYYQGLIILQYSTLPNALGTVRAIVSELIQDQIIAKVRDGFNLDSAIGNQLTILGTYRGAPRVVFGLAPGDYWSLVPYADAAPNSYFGWALYAGADPTWKWEQYNDLNALATTLTDSQLRRLIKLRAMVHSSALGLGDLDLILYSVFGVYVNVLDNKDMSITYQHQSIDPDADHLWNIAVLSNSLPHPAGVSFTVVEI